MLNRINELYSPRPATEDDLPGVMNIEKQSYTAPWTLNHFLKELSNSQSTFLVLTDDETDTQIVGYIIFWHLENETHLLNMAVDPQWRGLGVGASLLNLAVNQALKLNHKRMFLEVRTNNEGAIQLYKKLGFSIDHTKKNFYQNGDPAYFMVRIFNYEDQKLT